MLLQWTSLSIFVFSWPLFVSLSLKISVSLTRRGNILYVAVVDDDVWLRRVVSNNQLVDLN
ncbi:hypothetical protein Hanom_Chr03g00230591 [Helianthus anomalus]